MVVVMVVVEGFGKSRREIELDKLKEKVAYTSRIVDWNRL